MLLDKIGSRKSLSKQYGPALILLIWYRRSAKLWLLRDYERRYTW